MTPTRCAHVADGLVLPSERCGCAEDLAARLADAEREVAELRQALTGRTVSCAGCARLAEVEAAARRKMAEECRSLVEQACRCDPAFTDRGRDDPACQAHDIADAIARRFIEGGGT